MILTTSEVQLMRHLQPYIDYVLWRSAHTLSPFQSLEQHISKVCRVLTLLTFEAVPEMLRNANSS